MLHRRRTINKLRKNLKKKKNWWKKRSLKIKVRARAIKRRF